MPAGATPCAEHRVADFYHTPGLLLPEDLREEPENQGLIQRRCENQTCECVEEPGSTHRRARDEMAAGEHLAAGRTSVPAGGEDLDPLRQTWRRTGRNVEEERKLVMRLRDAKKKSNQMRREEDRSIWEKRRTAHRSKLGVKTLV